MAVLVPMKNTMPVNLFHRSWRFFKLPLHYEGGTFLWIEIWFSEKLENWKCFHLLKSCDA